MARHQEIRHQEIRHPEMTSEGETSDPAMRGRPVAVVQLIATAALAVSTLVAVTAVSIGFARADVLGGPANAGGATLAIAAFIGLLLGGVGGLTALMTGDRRD